MQETRTFQVGDVVHCDGARAILGDVTFVKFGGGVVVEWRKTETTEQPEDLLLDEAAEPPAVIACMHKESQKNDERDCAKCGADLSSFTVMLNKDATDTLTASIEVAATSPEEAQAIAEHWIDECDPRIDELEFAFDQCGETGDVTVHEVRK